MPIGECRYKFAADSRHYIITACGRVKAYNLVLHDIIFCPYCRKHVTYHRELQQKLDKERSDHLWLYQKTGN
jgi:hypothetical protein